MQSYISLATFSLTAVNVGTFPLGESDRIVTLFARERGLHRAVAKGARKPGTKLSGKSEPLNINRMLLAKGRSLDIITQCESVETFGSLRKDLQRLSYALYYAELTTTFGQGLSEDAARYFDRLSLSIGLMAESPREPALLCLEFEFALLEMLGIRPELDVCVACREPLTEQNLSSFNHDLGGFLCRPCYHLMRRRASENHSHEHGGESGLPSVAESAAIFDGHTFDKPVRRPVVEGVEPGYDRDTQLAVGNIARRREAIDGQRANVFVTPMVWKRLILSRTASELLNNGLTEESLLDSERGVQGKATQAARRIMQGYIEYKAGRRMRSLDLLANLPS
ncbi:MAG: DNA repair protein RecO [Cyanobacteria bacterium SZAS TMP-1]|nr:DNA repair protein RecO [Cyanobacteria bacterium SZAS TMP-1]